MKKRQQTVFKRQENTVFYRIGMSILCLMRTTYRNELIIDSLLTTLIIVKLESLVIVYNLQLKNVQSKNF